MDKPRCLRRVASATPDLRLPSQRTPVPSLVTVDCDVLKDLNFEIHIAQSGAQSFAEICSTSDDNLFKNIETHQHHLLIA